VTVFTIRAGKVKKERKKEGKKEKLIIEDSG
jgi:hypothetical protein